jgi:hypothetical protein
MKNLYDFKNAYSFSAAIIKMVVIIFILSFVIFSLLFDLQLNHLSSALEKINPLTRVEEYRIKNISFADGDYQNGFLEFSAENLRENDSITLAEENSLKKSDSIIISNKVIYKVVEGDLIIIGIIDNRFNGKDGRKLRINFSNNFLNEDFANYDQENKDILGWTVVNEEVKFGVDKIAGLRTPQQSTSSAESTQQLAASSDSKNDGTFKTELKSGKENAADYSLGLISENMNAEKSQGIVRGPYIHSEREFYLNSGDQLVFDWKAEAAADAYSIYGYLVDVNNNHIQVILDQRGKDENDSSSWEEEKVRVSKSGKYILVFVGGSYDFTGGRAVGAEIYLDNIRIAQKNNPNLVTAEDLNNIVEKVVIRKTAVSSFFDNHLKIRVKNNIGEVAEEEIVFNDEKENIVFARDNPNALSTEQDKSGPAQSAVDFTLEKYNHKYPERVDKLIINSPPVQTKAAGKGNFSAIIYADRNKNGVVDPGEEKVAEAAKITFKAESISRDEKGNYHLLVNPESKTGTALNIVLDLESIDSSKIDRRKSSKNYIIEIKAK